MKICESCSTENSENAEVCLECGELLSKKNSDIKQKSKFSEKKNILIFFLIIIIVIGIYFVFLQPKNNQINVDSPQIDIEQITINEIEKDWLENSSWQISATLYYKILNSNDFVINITNIIFSIDLLDDNVYSKIYDGSSDKYIIRSNNELNVVESFWFLSDDEGVNYLHSGNLHYRIQGTAFYNVNVSPSHTQYGSFQFIEEI